MNGIILIRDIVGHGTLLVDHYGSFRLKFTDGKGYYECRPYSLNTKNEILFHVIKLSEHDKDTRDGLKKTLEEIKKAHPFVFRLKGNKYVGNKNGKEYFAIKVFNTFIVMDKSKYYNVLDDSLRKKIQRISYLLNKVRSKLIQ